VSVFGGGRDRRRPRVVDRRGRRGARLRDRRRKGLPRLSAVLGGRELRRVRPTVRRRARPIRLRRPGLRRVRAQGSRRLLRPPGRLVPPALRIQIAPLCFHLDVVARKQTWRRRSVRGAPVGSARVGTPILFTRGAQIKVSRGPGLDAGPGLPRPSSDQVAQLGSRRSSRPPARSPRAGSVHPRGICPVQ
jgi:hypothetical protein